MYDYICIHVYVEYIDDDGNVIKVPGAQYDPDGVRSLY